MLSRDGQLHRSHSVPVRHDLTPDHPELSRPSARIEELRSHVVAVVATDVEGNIASFSNHCGIAAKWCIAAPGLGFPVASFEAVSEDEALWGYEPARGTSFAHLWWRAGLR